MTDRTVEEIESELKSIRNEQLKLTVLLNERQKQLAIKEAKEFSREHECCKDVCSIIDKLIKIDRDSLFDISYQEKQTERKLKELNIKSRMPLLSLKKDINTMSQRITELERLKEMLRNAKVCDCL